MSSSSARTRATTPTTTRTSLDVERCRSRPRARASRAPRMPPTTTMTFGTMRTRARARFARTPKSTRARATFFSFDATREVAFDSNPVGDDRVRGRARARDGRLGVCSKRDSTHSIDRSNSTRIRSRFYFNFAFFARRRTFCAHDRSSSSPVRRRRMRCMKTRKR